MKDQSSITYGKTASQLIELVLGGRMTVETYMESLHLLGDLLRLSVRTTVETTSQDGSENYMLNAAMQAEEWEQSFTRKVEPPTQGNNLLLSHSLCSCCFSEKQDTDEKSRL